MQHIDEGMAHEYLDRGGDLDPSQLPVTAHLSECAACRARVEDARTIRARSADILRAAAPARLSAPPFESIVARGAAQRDSAAAGSAAAGSAAAKPVARPRTGIPRLAWAATVVLALGAGWMANSLYRSGALNETESTIINESGVAEPATDAAIRSDGAVPDGAPRAVSPTSPVSPPTVGASAPEPAAQGSGAGANQAAGRGREVAAPSSELRREAVAETGASQKAAEKSAQRGVAADASPVTTNSAARQGFSAGSAASRAAVPQQTPAPAPPPAAPAPAPAPVIAPPPPAATADRDFSVRGSREGAVGGLATIDGVGDLMGAATWRSATVADASAALGGPPAAAAGLEIVDVAVASPGNEVQARVRIRQRTADGATIEIIQARAGMVGGTRDTAFVVLARSQRGATMLQLLRYNELRLAVTGTSHAIIDRIVPTLRIGVPQ